MTIEERLAELEAQVKALGLAIIECATINERALTEIGQEVESFFQAVRLDHTELKTMN